MPVVALFENLKGGASFDDFLKCDVMVEN
ncbi:MAG TPA: hypothetical protein VEZ90_02730 [Blastocatellia bacterium]|nr:hypothetical protein [Blastocatellia bacterium]